MDSVGFRSQISLYAKGRSLLADFGRLNTRYEDLLQRGDICHLILRRAKREKLSGVTVVSNRGRLCGEETSISGQGTRHPLETPAATRTCARNYGAVHER